MGGGRLPAPPPQEQEGVLLPLLPLLPLPLPLLPLPLLLMLNRPEITRISNFTSMNLREMWALPVFWWQVRPR